MPVSGLSWMIASLSPWPAATWRSTAFQQPSACRPRTIRTAARPRRTGLGGPGEPVDALGRLHPECIGVDPGAVRRSRRTACVFLLPYGGKFLIALGRDFAQFGVSAAGERSNARARRSRRCLDRSSPGLTVYPHDHFRRITRCSDPCFSLQACQPFPFLQAAADQLTGQEAFEVLTAPTRTYSVGSVSTFRPRWHLRLHPCRRRREGRHLPHHANAASCSQRFDPWLELHLRRQ